MADKKTDTKDTAALDPAITTSVAGGANPPDQVNIAGWPGLLDVNLQGTPTPSTPVQGFWEYLRQRTDAISFNKYSEFIENVLCQGAGTSEEQAAIGAVSQQRVTGVDAYPLLRAATEAFLFLNCGSLSGPTPTPLAEPESSFSRFGGKAIDAAALELKLRQYMPDKMLPYIHTITSGLSFRDPKLEQQGFPLFCDDLDSKVLDPIFIELLWSYWHEEAMVVQSINALSLRFQNKRRPGERDPLANLETHPLRPMANLLWGYIQDDDHRLTVARRAYEYEHEYGFSLLGRAVPAIRVADRRSKFIEAFHTLLHQTAVFYDRAANLTVRADAFPLLNALREVHLILAEGAHNQFREMPWTARVEMLIQQWLLGRREVRDFLGGRPAVPYTEIWMSSVDALRRAMGWGETASTNFNDLAVTGEKIVLSVRYGNWSDRIATDDEATGWAVFWKPEIQRYIHAYHTVTGVDLSATTNLPTREIDATPPSVLLEKRIARQQR